MISRHITRKYSDILKSSFNTINLIDCKSQNIYQNLALENYFFHHAQLLVPTLMMWRNDKTIVIGKHQNPFKECFMNKIHEDGVKIARRKSGGGAVYQDLGNTCFSFFIPIYDDTSPLDTRNFNNKVILKALDGFGIKGEISGRNDLEINGKKFSGSAYQLDLGGKNRRKKALHHGTLLLDVQFDDLWKYLNPNKKKLESKGVDSVVSRVMNLCTINPELEHELISTAMFESFKNLYDWCEPTSQTITDPFSVSPHV
jgi:lipoate---protein ligase